jgi:hypothetical protein
VKSHLLSLSFSITVFFPHHTEKNKIAPPEKQINVVSNIGNKADALYDELNLSFYGLSKKAFQYAYKGYQYLLKKEKINSTALLSICDLSQSSNKKRFYVLDLVENEVILTSYVAHGKGSGMEYATRFSNRSHSHQSSLGFYVTGDTYYGEHGLSLRLQGLEAGFNDHAVKRSIVMHGADYVGEEYLEGNKYMGRSYGCPAVPQTESESIINMIKNGTCLFMYYPAKNYLRGSKILKG